MPHTSRSPVKHTKISPSLSLMHSMSDSHLHCLITFLKSHEMSPISTNRIHTRHTEHMSLAPHGADLNWAAEFFCYCSKLQSRRALGDKVKSFGNEGYFIRHRPTFHSNPAKLHLIYRHSSLVLTLLCVYLNGCIGHHKQAS